MCVFWVGGVLIIVLIFEVVCVMSDVCVLLVKLCFNLKFFGNIVCVIVSVNVRIDDKC